MHFITGLLKRLGFIAAMALTVYGGAQLFLGYKRSAAMQRYGVAANLSPVVDACVDALNTAHKKFKNGMTHSDGCVCTVGGVAKSPGFDQAAAIPGVRTMLGVAQIYEFLERRRTQAQGRDELLNLAPDRVLRSAVAFSAAVRQCAGGDAGAALGLSRGA